MRIAQVSLRFDAPGGVETTVKELSTRLHRLGESVEVYTSDLYDEGRWERRSDYAPAVNGVPAHRFPVYRRLIPGLTMPMMVGLVEGLTRDRPEVIHAHSHRYGHVLESAAAARKIGCPLVVSAHYHPAHPGESPMKRGLLRVQDQLFGVLAYRGAAAVLVETAMEAEALRAFVPAGRIRQIPPGIDLELWRHPSTDHAPEGLPPRYLLYAGRIASNKGLPTLVRALARLPKETRLPVVLMGRDWGSRSNLERLAREVGVADELVWSGYIADPAQYRATFRGAAAFVLPSDYEAFGLVLLEAMAAGVPIVATAVGGVPEVLDHGRAGRLVPPRDEAALAEAIGGVLSDPGAAEALRAIGLSRVEEFSWDRAVESHRRLYQELCGSAAG